MRVLGSRQEGTGDEGGLGALWDVPGDNSAGGEDEDIAGRGGGAFGMTGWRAVQNFDVDDLWIEAGLIGVELVARIFQDFCYMVYVVLLGCTVGCHGL